MKKIVNLSVLLALFTVAPLMTACTRGTNDAAQESNMSVAAAQREIKIGMSGAEVIEVLGSPNMVTTDAKRRETWVYDRVSTNVQSSNSGAGVWLLVFGAGKDSHSYSSTQRTLTIIVKFDENNKVRDFAYRTSAF